MLGVSVLTLGSAVTGYYLYRVQNEPAIEQKTVSTVAADDEKKGIEGQRRPDFVLQDIAGKERHINEWDGQVIAINFWATWCAPCLKEIPEFVELQDKYGEKGLQFIGIALQQADEVKDFMQDFGMNYPVLAGELEVVEVSKSLGNDLGALPYTVILDRQGIIAYTKHGLLAGEVAEEVITSLL